MILVQGSCLLQWATLGAPPPLRCRCHSSSDNDCHGSIVFSFRAPPTTFFFFFFGQDRRGDFGSTRHYLRAGLDAIASSAQAGSKAKKPTVDLSFRHGREQDRSRPEDGNRAS